MGRCQFAFQSGRGLSFSAICLAAVLAFFAASTKADADRNLVTNGSFALNASNAAITQSTGFGSDYPSGTILDWSTAGYNFVFVPNTVDSTGATGQSGNVKLWGPGDGGPTNGLPEASPTGGNFIAADGAYEVSPITQTINGLTVGAKVYVSFAWAAGQQSGFTGPTTDNWTVSLGGSSATTQTVSLPSEGATAWMNQTFSFIATSTSEILSFTAAGTPSGQPPFALLANVVVTDPEPASIAVMLSGVVGLFAIARRRSRHAALGAVA